MNESEIRESYSRLTKYLIENKLSITTMESATSGQIASLITDTEGSSAIMKGAFVTYSNEAKIQQGVAPEIIEKYSVYSEETAKAMAEACAKTYKADIGIGITGTMGNVDPSNPESSVPGQVYFAFWIKGKLSAFSVNLAPEPSRYAYKMVVADLIQKKLFQLLQSIQ
ncbi:MAG: CinA family protein [Treponema sp.]|nr:CinA family protein [Spirochaetia bacterium]MDY2839272.1 CinA family protein [Treponema sp.]